MKTVFLRVIEAAVDDKGDRLRACVADPTGEGRYEVDPHTFEVVPKSPFAYWVGEPLRNCFRSHDAFIASGRQARLGPKSSDDFRFLRLYWEVPPENEGWVAHAKGGKFSRWYADLHLVFSWSENGRELRAFYLNRGESPSRNIRSESHYYRPGVTWPLRTNGFSVRVLPAEAIFGQKGPAAFAHRDSESDLLSIAAIMNSRIFGALVSVQLARTELAQSYEVGLVQQTPVPDLSPDERDELAALARQTWSLTRQLDTAAETSRAFSLPDLLQVNEGTLAERASRRATDVGVLTQRRAVMEKDIDDRCFGLYGVSSEGRAVIERNPHNPQARPANRLGIAEVQTLVERLLSWSLGTAFGRFDLRLAIEEQADDFEPTPFAPLPVCSPGMLTDSRGQPVDSAPSDYPMAFSSDGLLVDDPGHPRDLIGAVRTVFSLVFEDPDAHWHEADELVDGRSPRHLRAWFARAFFAKHIKTYTKSRRKAPIYWQLATPSASYSVWIYLHCFTSDTMFRVLNECVSPKLDHEQRKLAAMVNNAGPEPSRTQRAEVSTQEDFVAELHAMRAEVELVAPLWSPDLNDGVVINFAPLWRLVPQEQSWQKEVKKHWDVLVGGKYDWAHLAMHLWPERVVPKCLDDRSFAIAHGLEDAFWYEDAKGKWQKRDVSDSAVQRLIAERSSRAVKSALGDLLSAPAPASRQGSRKRRGSRSKSGGPR